MKNLRLERPLVCFDLETTGTGFGVDRIIQIGLVRVEPSGGRRTFEHLINPGMPIPPAATAIHGITDADVRDQPLLETLAEEILSYFTDADLAGFNSIRFDVPFLQADLARVGRTLDLTGRRQADALSIFHQMERRDLTAAYKYYCDKDLVGAHSALADAMASLEVLDAQIAHYDELPADMDGLHSFCDRDQGKFLEPSRKLAWNEQGAVVIAFGKYVGRPLGDIARSDPGYLQWMLKETIREPFSPQVRQIVQDALNGKLPKRI